MSQHTGGSAFLMIASVERISVPESGFRKLCSPLTLALLSLMAGMVLAMVLRAEYRKPTRSEVARVVSPDGSASAVVYELSGDAKSPFSYQVEIAAADKSRVVALLAGAMRNDRAYGVNVRWSSPTDLSVEYFSAQSAKIAADQVASGARGARVSLHSGIRDDNAPAGGMLFNLQHARETGF